MQLCIGTSMAIIVPTSVRSYRVHKQRGFVLPDVLRRWTLPSMLGVGVGSALAAVAPPGLFKAGVGTDSRPDRNKASYRGRRPLVLGRELPGVAAMTAYGFAIGLASSLMGVAGGSLVAMGTDARRQADP